MPAHDTFSFGNGVKCGGNAMADLFSNYVLDDQAYQYQPNNGKQKVEGMVVILYQLALHQMLEEVGKVF